MIGKIYKITNKINNKIYIGKTTQELIKRWKEHIREMNRYLKNGLKYNTRLYPSMVKYGIENFEITLIEDNLDEIDLDDREIYWISYFNSLDPNIGYNISLGGSGGPLFKGHKHSEETKKLMFQNNFWKGKKQDKDFVVKRTQNSRGWKKVQNLETGEVFINKTQAKTIYGTSVDDAIRNHRRAGGYHFVFIKDEGYNEDERINILNKYLEEEKIKRNLSHRKGIVTRNNWSDERKQAYKLLISNRSKENWSQMSSEKKERLRQKIKDLKNQPFVDLLKVINKDEFIDLYLIQKKSREDICSYYNISTWTLDKLIKEFKCSRRNNKNDR